MFSYAPRAHRHYILIECFSITYCETCRFAVSFYLPEVESRTQGSRPRTQKNPRPRTAFPRTDTLEAKDRNARGQGQIPRTQAQAFSKKKGLQIFFSGNSLAHPEFLIGGGLNYKSHAMTSSNFFQRGSFCGTKIS